MIFVTVGSMFPFDRLIQEMDQWAERHGHSDVFAQIGNGTFEPAHMRWTRRMHPHKFMQTVADADLIVAHAGMGTIISASKAMKPIVVLPRLQKWGEHTTDHQLDTMKWLSDKPGIFAVSGGENTLDAVIEQALATKITKESLPKAADPRFLERIRAAVLS